MDTERTVDTPTPAAQPAPTEPAEAAADEKPAQRIPARYHLYSRINVSLRTMDIIIAVIVVLIVAALLVGIICK